jgi:TPR repeat protein
MAAAQGSADGQYYLGTMYCGRTGAAQDYPQAAKWYRRAAEQGHADAQYILGAMYGNGTGVSQDWVRAHMWFNLAAGSGNTESSRNRDAIAARMTPEQIGEAQALARACEQGYQPSA